jgi:methyl-accepting chemotaxis protein
MKLLDDMPFKFKIFLSPAACLLLLLLSAAGSFWGFSQQRSALTSIQDSRLPSYIFVARFEADLKDVNGLVNQSLGYDAMGYSPSEVAAIDVRLKKVREELARSLAARTSAAGASSESQALAALSAEFVKYDKAVAETLEMKPAGAAIASILLTTAQRQYEVLLKQTNSLREQRLDDTAADVAKANADAISAQTAIGCAAVLALALGLAVSWTVTRGLLSRLTQLSASVSSLAGGDLGQPVKASGRDEIGSLMLACEQLRTSLRNSISEVLSASESVRTGAGEIATGGSDLSQRTEHQASNLQETSASMEELSATISASAASARTASEMALAASAIATKGGELVNNVVETMNGISSDSQKIAEIVGTIDGIAFQTNILALNAAVEAARAGDRGRGFAVVADEVRSLAHRAAVSAREIKNLIGSSVESIDKGARLVNETGRTMVEIVQQVQRVTVLTGEISSATEEQRIGVGQVVSAVTLLDQMTQQNAALVEQSAAAAESLSDQATRLFASVSTFKLDSSDSGEPAGQLA